MSTDTLSPPSPPTSASSSPSAVASLPAAAPGSEPSVATDRKLPAVPNPMRVVVSFPPSSAHPQLTPPPRHSLRPRDNGYQFESDQRDASLTFDIAPCDRPVHQFSGCRFTPVRDALGKDFPMPGCRYHLQSPYELLVEFKFTPGSVEQVNVEPAYTISGVGGHSFDPQVGNDGGDIVQPPGPRDCD